jgi:hypothetical protein
VKGKKPLKVKFPWRKVGKNYVVVDPRTKKGVVLDLISWMVWIQCDGTVNVEQIVDVFSVNGNRDIVRSAITGILKNLTKSGLVQWV